MDLAFSESRSLQCKIFDSPRLVHSKSEVRDSHIGSMGLWVPRLEHMAGVSNMLGISELE